MTINSVFRVTYTKTLVHVVSPFVNNSSLSCVRCFDQGSGKEACKQVFSITPVVMLLVILRLSTTRTIGKYKPSSRLRISPEACLASQEPGKRNKPGG